MKENEVNSEVDICDGRKGEMTSNGIQRKDKNRENEMTKGNTHLFEVSSLWI